MRFLSLLITLVIIAYVSSLYLGSGNLDVASPDKNTLSAKQLIDQSRKTIDDLNQSLQKQHKVIKDLN